MKLWKAKKPISCVPGKSSLSKNEDKVDSIGLQPTNSAVSGMYPKTFLIILVSVGKSK